MQRARWYGAATLVACTLAGGAHADLHTYSFPMDGSQTCPATSPAGSGSATVVLDDVTGVVAVTGSYSGMTSDVTVAHIHGAAAAGSCTGIVVTLTHTGGMSGTLGGGGTLSAAEITDMLNGLHYINVHTVNNGAGEIRGQIECEPATAATTVTRNGLGCNLVGFVETSPAVLGSTWDTTVDVTTPPNVVASVVAVSLGGPIGGFKFGGTITGELLANPPFLPFNIAGGAHSIPIPDDCSLIGTTLATQAATFAFGDIRLQNALDVSFGTF